MSGRSNRLREFATLLERCGLLHAGPHPIRTSLMNNSDRIRVMQVKFSDGVRDAGCLQVRILIEASSRIRPPSFDGVTAIRLRLFFRTRRSHHNSALSKFRIVRALLYALAVCESLSIQCRGIEGLHCVVLARHHSLVRAAFIRINRGM